MSYQALYRVWRPQTFDELVGQPMIQQTLKNAVKNDQLSHAYLFTGPRGTGKTSVAKILAKAVNCPNQTDGNPCNRCEICQAITAGQLGDVIEIDAASNNGVDEIRDLRENIRYATTVAYYKVYIIDEVHMLTTGAFNALLKTLEEPPERVLFILATTEPHKIPATIISRTQRYDFKRIQPKDLIQRMREILDSDDIDYEEDALQVIARAANGGLRDALSLLDQTLSYQDGKLTTQDAIDVSGSLSQLAFKEYLLALTQEDTTAALTVLEEQLDQGKQASRFVEELTLFGRDLLMTAKTNHNYTLLTTDEMKPLLSSIPESFYYRLIDSLNEAGQKMRWSTQADLYLEVLTIQLAQPEVNNTPTVVRDTASAQSIKALQETVTTLQEAMATLQAQLAGQHKQIQAIQATADSHGTESDPHLVESSEHPVVPGEQQQPRPRPQSAKNHYQLNEQDVYFVLNNANREELQRWQDNWARMLQHMSPALRRSFTGGQVRAAGDGYALISFDNLLFAGTVQQQTELRQEAEQTMARILNEDTAIVCILDREWPTLRKSYAVLWQQNNQQPVPLTDYNPPAKQTVGTSGGVTESSDPNITHATQPAQTVEPSVSEPTETEAISAEQPVPEIVQKAVDLFGADKINVISQQEDAQN